MKYFKQFFLIFMFLTAVRPLQAQPDATKIIAAVLEKSTEVKSFEADVAIDVDVDFIRIPVKKGRVFYKAPDKFRFRATGFALVPKKGLNFSVMSMLQEPHTALFSSEDEKNFLIKVVPMNPESEFVIATLWVDKKAQRINKMNVTTNGQGNYTLEFTYGSMKYDLPVSTSVGFEIQQMDIPMKFIGNLKVDPNKAGERTKGSVQLLYSNFEINGSIPDSVFVEEE
jgi:outer membrane lipoprotein-sorting protein